MLDFADPVVLWILAAVPVLLLLVRWRRLPRTTAVPSLSLWEIARRMPREERTRRAPIDLRTLAELLAFSCLVLAAAIPRWRLSGEAGLDRVLVMDVSASMAALEEDGRRRIDLARQEAEEALREAGGEARFSLVLDPGGVVCQGVSAQEIQNRLENLQATDRPGNLLEAIGLAAEIARALSPGRVEQWVFTDSLPPGQARSDSTLRWFSVGQLRDNGGILSLHALPLGRQRIRASAVVANFGRFRGEFLLRARLDGAEVRLQQVSLGPGSVRWVDLGEFEARETAFFEVVLEPSDALATDNRAWADCGARSPKGLAWSGHRLEALERFFRAAGRMEPVYLAAGSAPPSPGGLTVCVQNSPTDWSEKNLLVIDPLESLPGLYRVGGSFNPGSLEVVSQHPLMRSVSLAGVRLSSARVLELSGTSWQVLARSQAGEPAIAVYEKGKTRILLVGFSLNPATTDWGLRHESFPVFWSNALEFLCGFGPKESASRARTKKTGQTFGSAGDAIQELSLEVADVSRPIVALKEATGPLVLERAGLYEILEQGLRFRFAANLFDRQETDLLRTIDTAEGRESSALRGGLAAERSGTPALRLDVLGIALAGALLLAAWGLWQSQLAGQKS